MDLTLYHVEVQNKAMDVRAWPEAGDRMKKRLYIVGNVYNNNCLFGSPLQAQQFSIQLHYLCSTLIIAFYIEP